MSNLPNWLFWIAAMILATAAWITLILNNYRLAHEKAREILGGNYSRYIELCREHGIELDCENLPGYDGDYSYCRFTLMSEGKTTKLNPQQTLRLLKHLKAGRLKQAREILSPG